MLKWLAVVLLVLVLLLTAVAVALQQWVSSADFRGRVAQQMSAALGVRVELGRISVDVWPLPAVALDQVQVKSQPPLSLERIEARPSWLPLLQGRREIATLLVRNAVVPQQALAAVAAGFDRAQRGARNDSPANPGGSGPGLLPRRIVLDHVTWVYAKGGSTTIDGQARLDPDGLPGSVKVDVRQGRFQGARASLDAWRGQLDAACRYRRRHRQGADRGPARRQGSFRGQRAIGDKQRGALGPDRAQPHAHRPPGGPDHAARRGRRGAHYRRHQSRARPASPCAMRCCTASTWYRP